MFADITRAAERVVELGRRLGADEVKAWGRRTVHTDLSFREGAVEKAEESTGQSLSLSMLVGGRYSAHGTSDLRPEALEAFLARAVEATGYLEPDPDRRMAERAQMGQSPLAPLDLDDPGFSEYGPAAQHAQVEALEAAVMALDPGDLVSTTAHTWRSRSEIVAAFSNGFQAVESETNFGLGADLTISEPGGRLPEARAYFSARHREDTLGPAAVAEAVWGRVNSVRDSGPCASGRYPMLLENRSVGRVLRALLRPLSGSMVWQGRSLFQERLGEQVAASGFSLYDDPLIPRALGSETFDRDGRASVRRPIVEGGVLRMWFLNLYYARKLGREPTTSGASNLVVPPGPRSPSAIEASLPVAIRVQSFLGGNANPTTGDFSFGIRGQRLERGEVTQNLAEMNISGNILDLMGRFAEAADDPWPWSSWRVPTLLFDGVQFSGT